MPAGESKVGIVTLHGCLYAFCGKQRIKAGIVISSKKEWQVRVYKIGCSTNQVLVYLCKNMFDERITPIVRLVVVSTLPKPR